MTSNGPGVSPYDTNLSAGTRFLIELAAWVAGPWAVGQRIGGWAAVIALVVLVLLPAMFNTPGDKKTTGGVATPGPIRIVIEMILLVVAVTAAWAVWPVWLAVLVTLIGATMLLTGARRYQWLREGAPPVQR